MTAFSAVSNCFKAMMMLMIKSLNTVMTQSISQICDINMILSISLHKEIVIDFNDECWSVKIYINVLQTL